MSSWREGSLVLRVGVLGSFPLPFLDSLSLTFVSLMICCAAVNSLVGAILLLADCHHPLSSLRGEPPGAEGPKDGGKGKLVCELVRPLRMASILSSIILRSSASRVNILSAS